MSLPPSAADGYDDGQLEGAGPHRFSASRSADIDEKLDRILEELQSINSHIKRIDGRVDRVIHRVDVTDNAVNDNALRMDRLEERLLWTEDRLDEALDIIDDMNNRLRENNSRLNRVPEGAEDAMGGIKPFLVDFFNSKCNTQLVIRDFEKAHRVGKFHPSQRGPRPIVFKIDHFATKWDLIEAAKGPIRNSDYSLMPDISDRARQRREDLWPLRAQLHDKGMKTYFKAKSTLHIEDEEKKLLWRFDTIEEAEATLRKKMPDLSWKKSQRS